MKGQYGQPLEIERLLLESKLWRKKKQGFFIEAGASMGEFISNTLYFELKHNWTGLLVEPNPDFLKELKLKNRNAWILPHCLSANPIVELYDFDASGYNGGLIQPGKTLPSDLGRTNKRNYEKFPQKTIQVQCFPLQAVLSALGNPLVDYFSLDIEGAEYSVLSTINWKKIHLSALSVETNHAGEIFNGSKEVIHGLLEQNGFSHVSSINIDDIFLWKQKFKCKQLNKLT